MRHLHSYWADKSDEHLRSVQTSLYALRDKLTAPGLLEALEQELAHREAWDAQMGATEVTAR